LNPGSRNRERSERSVFLRFKSRSAHFCDERTRGAKSPERFEPRRTQRDRRERPSGIGFKSRSAHNEAERSEASTTRTASGVSRERTPCGRLPTDLPLAASRFPPVAVRPPRDALSGRVSLRSIPGVGASKAAHRAVASGVIRNRNRSNRVYRSPLYRLTGPEGRGVPGGSRAVRHRRRRLSVWRRRRRLFARGVSTCSEPTRVGALHGAVTPSPCPQQRRFRAAAGRQKRPCGSELVSFANNIRLHVQR